MRRGGELAAASERVGKVSLVASAVGEMPSADALRTLALDVRDRMGNERGAVVALAGLVGGNLPWSSRERGCPVRPPLRQARLCAPSVSTWVVAAVAATISPEGGGTKPEGIPTALDAIRSQIEAL